MIDPQVAGWWQRAAAFGIDVLLGLGLAATLLLVGWSAPRGQWLWWLMLTLAALVLVAVAANRVYLPVRTGWTLGRSALGIAVAIRDGGAVRPWRLLVRDVAHVLDTLPLGLGWLWPLLDTRGRTFADMLARTEVRRAARARPDRARQVAVVLGAAALALVATGLGYAQVYRHQQAVAAAREEIAKQGPGLVTALWSFTVNTADEDFAHAQEKVTDGFRPTLVGIQEGARKRGLVDNTYSVPSSAVLSASPDQAAMLLLLQGERGAAANARFISASVRAEFEKSGGRWLVSAMTLLRPPEPAPAPPDGGGR